MKKAIAIIILGLMWCNVGFAAKSLWPDTVWPIDYWIASYKNYYNQTAGVVTGKSSISYEAAMKQAHNNCKQDKNFNVNKPEGCLMYEITEYYKKSASYFFGIKKPPPGLWNMWEGNVALLESKKSLTSTTRVEACITHSDTGEAFCYKAITREHALNVAKANCRTANPNNKAGCGSETTVAAKPTKPAATPDDGKIIIIGSGSGFFVSDQGHIVSNEHVIGVCKKVKAYEAGKEIYLDILATDSVNDIGLVKGKFQNIKYLNIKTDGAELGEDIIAFGYPLSQTLSDSVKLTKGIVSSLTGLGNNISQIQIDAAIQPGNSGGPVLNMNGQVVGIASAGLSKLYMLQKAEYIPENVNFAVASQTLTAFLKAHKISIGTSASRTLSTKQLAKIGEPATIQLFCMNTKAEYAKLKKADKHSDVLLDLQ